MPTIAKKRPVRLKLLKSMRAEDYPPQPSQKRPFILLGSHSRLWSLQQAIFPLIALTPLGQTLCALTSHQRPLSPFRRVSQLLQNARPVTLGGRRDVTIGTIDPFLNNGSRIANDLRLYYI